jgi:hypothetical protein
MFDLRLLWGFLDHLPGLYASKRRWVNAVGNETFSAAKHLLSASGQATTVPHPEDGRPLKVIRLSGGRITVVCEVTGATVATDIVMDDIRCFRLNPVQLRCDLARCLGLVGDSGPIRSASQAFVVGIWNAAPGRMVPVFLLLAPTMKAAINEVVRLAMANKDGFVLLVPTPLILDGSLRMQIKDSKGLVVCLGDVIDGIEQGFLLPSAGWETVKSAYR